MLRRQDVAASPALYPILDELIAKMRHLAEPTLKLPILFATDLS